MERFMKKLLIGMAICVLFLGIAGMDIVHAADQAKIGVRGGVGTDITGELTYGVGANYLMELVGGNSLELGVILFGGSFEEESDGGFTETTDVFGSA